MKFSCPNCGQHIEAEEDMAGAAARCPTCNARLAVPSAAEGQETNDVKETDIVFDCPQCGKNLAVEKRGAGLTVPCPACGKPIVIPASDRAATASKKSAASGRKRKVRTAEPVQPTRAALEQRRKDAEQDRLDTLRRAAARGDAQAQYELGCYYDPAEERLRREHGDEVKKVKWFRKAAEQGHAAAQAALGCAYAIGAGVPQDNVEAHKWYSLSAAQGYWRAERVLPEHERLYMTADEIAEAQRRAREFKLRK